MNGNGDDLGEARERGVLIVRRFRIEGEERDRGPSTRGGRMATDTGGLQPGLKKKKKLHKGKGTNEEERRKRKEKTEKEMASRRRERPRQIQKTSFLQKKKNLPCKKRGVRRT